MEEVSDGESWDEEEEEGSWDEEEEEEEESKEDIEIKEEKVQLTPQNLDDQKAFPKLDPDTIKDDDINAKLYVFSD